jgi:citrate synthase
MSRWLTTAQAAERLGVKRETLYAYVSRGVLARHRGADKRSSRFDRVEVERLAARTRRGGRAGSLEVVIDTELTMLDPAGRLYYRGQDAAELARTSSAESVAALLWGVPAPAPWQASPAALRVGRRAQAALPSTAHTIDRVRVIVAAVASTNPVRDDRRPAVVVEVARSLIAAAVDCLPELSPPASDALAARLWSRLCPRAPRRGELRAMNAALILLMDHELPASTLAARIAASVWADPYLVALTGLCVGGGVLHGAISSAVEALLLEPSGAEDVPRVVGERLRRGEVLPGFGHAVYTGVDPRASVLLALAGSMGRRSAVDAVAEALVSVVGAQGGPQPNVDFGLATFAVKAGLTPGSGEVIFLVARMVGVLAHALEEYPHRLRFRPRALYTGQPVNPS